MLKIRLKRLGAKKAPTYRIIVINSNCNDDGSLNYVKKETVKLSKKAQAKAQAEAEAKAAAEAEAAQAVAEEAPAEA